MKRDGIITIVVIGVILAIAVGFTLYSKQKSAAVAKSNSAAGQALAADPDAFETMQGEKVTLFETTTDYTVAYTWASWCPQCGADLIALSDLADKVTGDVRVLAINRKEPAATAERYLARFDTSNSLELVIDTKDSFYNSIDGYAMPELVVYNRNGDEVLRQRGVIDISAIQQATREQ